VHRGGGKKVKWSVQSHLKGGKRPLGEKINSGEVGAETLKDTDLVRPSKTLKGSGRRIGEYTKTYSGRRKKKE